MAEASTADSIDDGTSITAIASLTKARTELANAKNLDDVLRIRDIAKATEVYLRAAQIAGDAANDAAEVRILAEHKAGGILRDMKDRKQRAGAGGDYTSDGASSLNVTKLEDLGVSRMESHRWQRLSDVDPKIIEAYTRVTRANGEEVTTAGLMRALKDAESFLWRSTQRNAPKMLDGMELRIGDCREVLADIPDNSVSLILTDPPYAKSATEPVEELYEWLGEFAARALMPGGSLLCLTGTINVDRDIRIFAKYLKYHWIIARFTYGPKGVIHSRGVSCGWKPILWYVKERRWSNTLVHDVVESHTVPSHLDHEWEQGTDGVERLILELTEPGALVVDPFAGTAAWGRVIAESGRRWIGSDLVSGGTTVAQ